MPTNISPSKRELIAPGLALPFYPLRPKLGVALPRKEALTQIGLIYPDFILQPKLGGDRVCIAKVNDCVIAQNRHKNWYSFNFDLTPWEKLPNNTCLDGEVFEKKFFPFDLLAYDGQSWLHLSVESREDRLKDICGRLGQPYIYGTPKRGWYNWLSKGKTLLPQWEGVVLKKFGSTYDILGTAAETDEWIKCRWET